VSLHGCKPHAVLGVEVLDKSSDSRAKTTRCPSRNRRGKPVLNGAVVLFAVNG
jgi:hypothetical protein